MIQVMLYALLCSGVICLAALLIEKGCALACLPRRAVWATALCLSVAFPAYQVMFSTPNTMSTPQLQLPTPESSTSALQPQAIESEEQSAGPIGARTGRWEQHSWPNLHAAFRALWLGSSLATLAFIAIMGYRLHRISRGWHSRTLDGETVRIADATGPAVFGLFRPQIVLPSWLLDTPPDTRQHVMAHEREHIRAHDHVLAVLALLWVALVPWNVPLWWQLRRLRFAIEVDCDARVLRHGADAQSYGEMLLSVGQRKSQVPMVAIALTEPITQLERRIRIMMTSKGRHAALAMVACGVLATSMLMAAAQVEAPHIDRNDSLRLPLPVDAVNNPMQQQVQEIARIQFADVYAGRAAEPMLMLLVLNNDWSVDIAQTVPLSSVPQPFGQKEAAERLAANGLDQRDALMVTTTLKKDPRNVARSHTLVAGVRRVHKSRGAAAVDAAIKARFPELYLSAESSRDTLVTAVMGEGAAIVRAEQEIVAGHSGENRQEERFARLGLTKEQTGTVGWIGPKAGRVGPMVLYAYPKASDPAIDAQPAATPAALQATPFASERKLVERYFPDLLDDVAHAPEFAWLVFSKEGDLLETGRLPLAEIGQVREPQFFEKNLLQQFPGMKMVQARIVGLSAIVGKRAIDTSGKGLLVGFVWITPRLAASDSPAPQALNSELVQGQPLAFVADAATKVVDGVELSGNVSIRRGDTEIHTQRATVSESGRVRL